MAFVGGQAGRPPALAVTVLVVTGPLLGRAGRPASAAPQLPPLARERGGGGVCVRARWPRRTVADRRRPRGRSSWAVSFRISDYSSTARGCREIWPGLWSLTAQRASVVKDSRPAADLSSSSCFRSSRNPAWWGPKTVSRESRPEPSVLRPLRVDSVL